MRLCLLGALVGTVAVLSAYAGDPEEENMAKPGQFPFIVHVYTVLNICTGVILSPRTVVTSAFCVHWANFYRKDWKIQAGTTTAQIPGKTHPLQPGDDPSFHNLNGSYYHRGAQMIIIYVDPPIKFDKLRQPITHVADQEPAIGLAVQTAGYTHLPPVDGLLYHSKFEVAKCEFEHHPMFGFACVPNDYEMFNGVNIGSPLFTVTKGNNVTVYGVAYHGNDADVPDDQLPFATTKRRYNWLTRNIK